MQDSVMLDSLRPFAKLAQDNMAAFAAFATAPEAGARNAASAPAAYGQLLQTLTQNYTEFLVAVSQNTMQLMSQGQAALVGQAQEAGEEVVEASTPKRRSR